jgi:hypothetical protein
MELGGFQDTLQHLDRVLDRENEQLQRSSKQILPEDAHGFTMSH